MKDTTAAPTPPAPASDAGTAARLAAIDRRLDRGSKKMQEQADAIDAMRSELAANTTITAEVRELLALGRNGLKVLGWLGAVIKWAGGLATASLALYAALYALTHDGRMPPK